jgi:uncharacterized repeat protein (TIGR03803 family)
MNQVAIRSLSGRFKLLPTLVLVAAVSLFANARTGQSGARVEPSDALTYSQSVLHAFTGYPDGMSPKSNLVADSSGNLYGTTYYGGSDPCSCGTVFELSPDGNGGWTYNNIYSVPGGTVGPWPNSLTIDSQGNLYGTTAQAPGAVFELCQEPNGGGWVLCNNYGFTGGSDGQSPHGPVILDAAGNVYVVTQGGGENGYGTVDELVLEPGIGGGAPYWSEQTLYAFTGGKDGAYPSGPLIRDKKGDFYGTTNLGGIANNGTVFKLQYTAKKGWVFHTVHTFQGAPNDGLQPFGRLVLDAVGNIYGMAAFGTWPNLVGAVYELAPSGQITWIYVPSDGFANMGYGLAFDKAGNLYAVGTGGTINQYCGSGCGAVYELTPPSGGQSTAWTANVLFGFDAGADGSNPVGPLLLDSAGNIYGVASNGGAKYGQAGAGVVFELKPNPVATATTIVKDSPSPSKTGQTVTVGFTVAQTVKGFSQPTGTVTVNAISGEACFVALPLSGKASCQLAFESAGIRTLTATYSGDSANQGSVSGAVTQSTFNSTSTKITEHAPDPAKVGKAATVEFSVIAKDETKQTKPTGTVTVNASTGESCTGTLSVGDKGKCQLTFGSSGIRTLTAIYAGDADNEGSVSKAIEQAVE